MQSQRWIVNGRFKLAVSLIPATFILEYEHSTFPSLQKKEGKRAEIQKVPKGSKSSKSSNNSNSSKSSKTLWNEAGFNELYEHRLFSAIDDCLLDVFVKQCP
jgi:hypothetical protein